MLYSDTWQQWRRDLAVCATAGTFLAVTDPYDAASALPFWGSLIYWTGLILLGNLFGTLTAGLLLRSGRQIALPALLGIVSVSSAISVTTALLITSWATARQPTDPGGALHLFALVWVIAAAMTGIRFLTSASAPPEAPVSGSAKDPCAAFLERLPLKYRQASLYAISAEDHYLRVHTSLGSDLILLRLSDAVRELETAPGLRVHRSWWVAHSAIRGTRRDSGKLILLLEGGLEVPVSKTFLPRVRAAGLAR